jgi:hypothetical protein
MKKTRLTMIPFFVQSNAIREGGAYFLINGKEIFYI